MFGRLSVQNFVFAIDLKISLTFLDTESVEIFLTISLILKRLEKKFFLRFSSLNW